MKVWYNVRFLWRFGEMKVFKTNIVPIYEEVLHRLLYQFYFFQSQKQMSILLFRWHGSDCVNNLQIIFNGSCRPQSSFLFLARGDKLTLFYILPPENRRPGLCSNLYCQAWVQVQGLSQISNKRPGPGAWSYNCNVSTTTTQKTFLIRITLKSLHVWTH